jgi:hypothetical protein
MASLLRTRDVVLADGTFRIAITPKRRVVAVLDAPTTALGPLHIVLAIDRAPFLPDGVSPLILQHPTIETAGLFDDIGHAFGSAAHAVEHAAEGAFNAASKVVTTVARPAFDVVKAAAGGTVHLLAHTIPFLPDQTRRGMDAAARTVMRAKLGDITAKDFIRGIGEAAKAGVHAAQAVGDKLLDASKIVAHVADLPVLALGNVPGVGPFVKSISPLQTWDHMATAIQHGDFKQLEKIAKQQLSMAQDVISLVPGVGTGISSAISAGLAVLEGGSPLEIAIKAAYGAIPIPPGIRNVTDIVLDTVLRLAFHGASLTDVAINAARDEVPAGIPRDVFDTLINLVVHKQPVQRVAGGLLEHFVSQYAPAGVGLDLPKALAQATDHVPGVFAALPHIAAATGVHAPGSPLHIPGLQVPLALPPGPRMIQPLHLARPAHA